jgi:hypothetical protein
MNSNLKRLSVMTGVAAALTVLYVTVGVVVGRSIGKVRTEYRTVKKELDEVLDKVESMSEIERDIQRTKKVLAELEAKAIRKGELSEAIRVFEAEAYALGMSGDRFLIEKERESEAAKEEPPKGRYRKLRFRIELECPYGALVQYLASLRRLPMHVGIESVTVERVGSAEDALHAKLGVSTYVEL